MNQAASTVSKAVMVERCRERYEQWPVISNQLPYDQQVKEVNERENCRSLADFMDAMPVGTAQEAKGYAKARIDQYDQLKSWATRGALSSAAVGVGGLFACFAGPGGIFPLVAGVAGTALGLFIERRATSKMRTYAVVESEAVAASYMDPERVRSLEQRVV